MRTKELTEFARDTTTKVAAMKARHAFQITGEKDARAILAKDSKTAWRQHEATYGSQKTETQTRTPEAENRPQEPERKLEPAPAKAGDRFGRSRDRQPRAPRRREATTGREIEQPDAIAAQRDVGAENSPVEPGYLVAQFPTPEQQNAPQAQPEAAQGTNSGAGDNKPKTGWSSHAEREEARRRGDERREAQEREENERDPDDFGREME
jgi:hypothetical protein